MSFGTAQSANVQPGEVTATKVFGSGAAHSSNDCVVDLLVHKQWALQKIYRLNPPVRMSALLRQMDCPGGQPDCFGFRQFSRARAVFQSPRVYGKDRAIFPRALRAQPRVTVALVRRS